jgi:hypothetical protein
VVFSFEPTLGVLQEIITEVQFNVQLALVIGDSSSQTVIVKLY